MLKAAMIWSMLLVGLSASANAAEQIREQQGGPHARSFVGLHRNEGRNGKPESVTVSDGKDYFDISEQEYRDGDYAPPFEKLWTRIVRRIPVRNPALNEDKKE
jgi:hypothetical protein